MRGCSRDDRDAGVGEGYDGLHGWDWSSTTRRDSWERAGRTAAGQKTEGTAKKSVEGGSCILLPEVSSSKRANEIINLEAGHCLVAETQVSE